MITKEQKEQIIRDYGRSFQGKSKGSSLQKRSFEDGRTEKRSSCLPEKERYREISCSDRETWSEKIRTKKQKAAVSVIEYGSFYQFCSGTFLYNML